MQINKDEPYWKLHKQLLNNKLNALNKEEYDIVVSDPFNLIALKIKTEVEEEVIKMLNKDKVLTA